MDAMLPELNPYCHNCHNTFWQLAVASLTAATAITAKNPLTRGILAVAVAVRRAFWQTVQSSHVFGSEFWQYQREHETNEPRTPDTAAQRRKPVRYAAATQGLTVRYGSSHGGGWFEG